MARQTYHYLGSGKIKMREVGAAAPFVEIGNCSALTLGATIDTKSVKNFQRPGGGTAAKVDRVSAATCALTAYEIDGANLARASNGAMTSVAAGTVTGEALLAYKGGTTPLEKPPTSITSIVPHGGGTAYAAGTDYVITPGGIYVPSTSAIPDPTGTTPNIDVTYANGKQQVVEALVNSGKEYELLFEGLNEAESDKPVIVHVYRVKFAPTQAINWLGDDFASLEINGEALADANKTGAGVSQYWKATIVE